MTTRDDPTNVCHHLCRGEGYRQGVCSGAVLLSILPMTSKTQYMREYKLVVLGDTSTPRF